MLQVSLPKKSWRKGLGNRDVVGRFDSGFLSCSGSFAALLFGIFVGGRAVFLLLDSLLLELLFLSGERSDGGDLSDLAKKRGTEDVSHADLHVTKIV